VKATTRIVLADDHPIVLNGLRSLIAAESDLELVGEASSGGRLPDLTDREGDVLRLVALGYTNKEIARQLDVGVKSVETYKSRGVEKLGLKTRAELVRYASAQGWLSDV